MEAVIPSPDELTMSLPVPGVPDRKIELTLPNAGPAWSGYYRAGAYKTTAGGLLVGKAHPAALWRMQVVPWRTGRPESDIPRMQEPDILSRYIFGPLVYQPIQEEAASIFPLVTPGSVAEREREQPTPALLYKLAVGEKYTDQPLTTPPQQPDGEYTRSPIVRGDVQFGFSFVFGFVAVTAKGTAVIFSLQSDLFPLPGALATARGDLAGLPEVETLDAYSGGLWTRMDTMVATPTVCG